MGVVTGAAGWLEGSERAVYTVLHEPASGAIRDTAVLIVSPFGWDELVSHRARRYWAVRLAEAGFSCLRFDLPGTGDSVGGPEDPELVDSWITSISETAQWLRSATRARRVVALGIGLGGLLACRAIAEGAPIDDLLLWGARGRGRFAVRELIAQAGMVADPSKDRADPNRQPEGGADVAGFLLSDESRAALSAIDVAELSFPPRDHRRALLLGRDGADADPALRKALAEHGFDVTVLPTDDYGHLMEHPQSVDLKRPDSTIRRTTDWLVAGESPDRAPEVAAPAPDPEPGVDSGPVVRLTQIEFEHGGGRLRETLIPLDAGGATSFGILAEPVDGGPAALGAVILNAGTMRKVGLHRMSLEQGRRWAVRGVPTVRFDIEAIGDAAGPGDRGGDERGLVTTTKLTSPRTVAAVADVMNQLRETKFAERFLMVGHCSGAYLSFHTALASEDVVGCFGVNQMAFVDNDELYQDRVLALMAAAVRKGLLKRIREQGITAHELRQVRDAVRHRVRRRGSDSAEEQDTRTGVNLLDQLSHRGVALELFFTRTNHFYEELGVSILAMSDRWPRFRIRELPTDDHNTRAIWLQEYIHQQMDAALESLLANQDTSSDSGGSQAAAALRGAIRS